jgi:hypothetical protein
MTDFNIRSDNVDVEQIMHQIRARIREKRGVDYSEEEIRELANVKLERFLDPRGVRSDLLQQFRRAQQREPLPPPPNYVFEDSTIFDSHRAPVRWIRALLKPLLKLFFNPSPLIQALHIQSQVNTRWAEREARQDADEQRLGSLQYELTHNLVLEVTRLGIEVRNLKMRVESMSSRLDFDERRARALEGVVQYRPGVVAPLQPPTGAPEPPGGGGGGAGDAERRNRRRRRRGRKRPSTGSGRPELAEGRPGGGRHEAAEGHPGHQGSTPHQDSPRADDGRGGGSGDPSTSSGSSRAESRDEARAERSEPGGVQGAPPIQE